MLYERNNKTQFIFNLLIHIEIKKAEKLFLNFLRKNLV